MPCRRAERSTAPASTPISSRYRRTSWAARRASALLSCVRRTACPPLSSAAVRAAQAGWDRNVAGIAGFGAAAAAARRGLREFAGLARLRDRLERELCATTRDACIIGADSPRLPNTSLIAPPGRRAETLVIQLDLAGISVSAGAACSSGKVGTSETLAAMRVSADLARAAIRVSLGPTTTERDIDAFLGLGRDHPFDAAGGRRLRPETEEQSEIRMPAVQETIEQVRKIDVDQYKYGFETTIDTVKAPKGLNEDIVRFISAKKGEPEWMLSWRLDAVRALAGDDRADVGERPYPKIDFQNLYYYPRRSTDAPTSLAEIDPEILRTYERLGIPLKEQELLAGVRGVACRRRVRQRPSVTTFKLPSSPRPASSSARCRRRCAASRARAHLGSVVPQSDNFYAALNSAVFSTPVRLRAGGRALPMELSTYFRINEKQTGQFERTLIIADKGAYVSYLEGCTAPMRDEHQLHAAVVELIALDDAEIKYSTCRTGTRATPRAAAASIIS